MAKRDEACDHHWVYEHTVWQGRSENECAVHRQCSKCGLHQMAYTEMWSKPLKVYKLPDLRADMERGMRRGNG